MRAILGSYDSELTPAEYSPQLSRRMREAEDMVQKVHAHSSEMEVSARGHAARAPRRPLLLPEVLRLRGWGYPRSPASALRTLALLPSCKATPRHTDGGAEGRLLLSGHWDRAVCCWPSVLPHTLSAPILHSQLPLPATKPQPGLSCCVGGPRA